MSTVISEDGGEVLAAGESAADGDLGDTEICFPEQGCGTFGAHADELPHRAVGVEFFGLGREGCASEPAGIRHAIECPGLLHLPGQFELPEMADSRESVILLQIPLAVCFLLQSQNDFAQQEEEITPCGQGEAISVRVEFLDQLGDVPPGTASDGDDRRRLAKELDQAAAFRGAQAEASQQSRGLVS